MLICVAGLFGVGALALHTARRNRRPEQAVAVFDDPREAVLELLSIERQVHNGSETGVLTYQFRVGDSDRIWPHIVTRKQPAPLFLDDAWFAVGVSPRFEAAPLLRGSVPRFKGHPRPIALTSMM